MILQFEPPEPLIDFVWEAAKSAAYAVTQVSGYVTALQVLNRHRSSRIAETRLVFVTLLRRHVFCAHKPAGHDGRLAISVVFGDMEPFSPEDGHTRPVPLTYPMIAWLVGCCHSTLLQYAKVRKVPEQALALAEANLAEVYPPGRTIGEATFRERCKTVDW